MLYSGITMSYENDSPWKDALRFYNAARRRGWWTTKDGRSIHLTGVTETEIHDLAAHLGIAHYEIN